MLEKADRRSIHPAQPGAAGDGPVVVDDEPTMVLRKRARSRPVAITDGITVILTVLKGRHQGDIIELRRGDNLVGRGQGVHLHLDDRGVSRHHARLVVGIGGKTDVFDLESTNGTFVNGERITSASLRAGDRIRIGLEAVLELSHVPSDQGFAALASTYREPDAPVQRRRSTSVVEGSAEDLPPGTAAPGLATPCWGYSEAAIDAYGRLLEIRRKRLGNNHPSVAEMLETMGSAFQDNGDLEPALGCLRQALEIRETQEPPVPPAMARTLTLLAHCELALGRPQAAVRRLEQAEQLLHTSQTAPVELGCVRLSLARALWSLKIDPSRCIALARLARDAFAGGGTTTLLLHHDAQAWLCSVEAMRLDE